MTVRSYELDSLGHVNQAVYHQYAEHGRMEMIFASGFDGKAVEGKRIGPVALEAGIRYRRELRLAETFDVVTTAEWGEGKVFRMNAELIKTDGTVSASLTGVFGFMDLRARKLMGDPAGIVSACCAHPEILLDSNK
jgi:acyl-CoA thioester hydrolase